MSLAVPALAGTQLQMGLHDVLGRKVRTQEVSLVGTGKQAVQLNTLGCRPGSYLLRILGQHGAHAQRMLQIQ